MAARVCRAIVERCTKVIYVSYDLAPTACRDWHLHAATRAAPNPCDTAARLAKSDGAVRVTLMCVSATTHGRMKRTCDPIELVRASVVTRAYVRNSSLYTLIIARVAR
jgi:hypothetical protein